jgi:hypothetical protein
MTRNAPRWNLAPILASSLLGLTVVGGLPSTSRATPQFFASGIAPEVYFYTAFLSDNGGVVAATSGGQVVRWEVGGTPEALGPGTVRAASWDGSVLVGGDDAGAFRWTATSGFQTIGPGVATGVSGDGTVIVCNDGCLHPYRWKETAGIPDLSTPEAGVLFARCVQLGVIRVQPNPRSPRYQALAAASLGIRSGSISCRRSEAALTAYSTKDHALARTARCRER